MTVSQLKKVLSKHGALLEGLNIEGKGKRIVILVVVVQFYKRLMTAIIIVFWVEKPVFTVIALAHL
jgi:hypothetical protein